MLGLCEALAYLHGEGVVHRDLKPDNVLLVDGAPVLVDFGIAASMANREGRDTLPIEAEEGIAGTRRYMSPDQLRGKEVDARSDLYSLGCLMFELLTGSAAFAASHPHQMDALKSSALIGDLALLDGYATALATLVRRLVAPRRNDRPGHAMWAAEVLRALGAQSPFRAVLPRPRPYLYRPRVAGRRAERAQIDALLLACMGGEGGTLVLAGPLGTGRTRLLHEAARMAAHRGFRAITSACVVEREGAPLQAFLPLLRAVAAFAGEGRTPLPARTLYAFDPALSSLPGAEASGTVAEVVAAVRAALAGLTELAPVALCIDDAQAADEISAAVLGSLQQEPLECCALVLAYDGSSPRPSGVPVVELGNLGLSAVKELIGDMLGTPDPSPALIKAVSVRAEGNPLLMVSTLYGALEAGWLRSTAQGGWSYWPPPQDRLPTPDASINLANRRLDGLDPSSRELVEAAATIGRTVDVTLLCELTGVELSDLDGRVAKWRAAGVLVPEGEGLRFEHGIVRDAAYAVIEAPRRIALHAAAAAALDRGGSPLVAEAAGDHWAKAGEPVRAATSLLRAGTHAAMRQAYASAERLLRRSCELAPGSATEVEALAILAFNVLRATGRMDEASSMAEQAHSLAVRVDNARATIQASISLALVRSETDAVTEALSLVDEGVRLARESGDSALLSRALAAQGPIRLSACDHQGSVSSHTEALRLLPPDSPRARPLRQNLIIMQLMVGGFDVGRAGLVAMLEEPNLTPSEEVGLVHNLAAACLNGGRLEEALERAEYAEELAALADRPRFRAAAARLVGRACTALGHFDRAEEALLRAHSGSVALGDLTLANELVGDRAELALARGNGVAAERLATAHAGFEPVSIPAAARGPHLLSVIARQRGEVELATTRSDQALAAARTIDDRVSLVIVLCGRGMCDPDGSTQLAEVEALMQHLQVGPRASTSRWVERLRAHCQGR
jgi:tetratricopeptide (TPR) repeat protein